MTELLIIHCDDWAGAFVNGILHVEGHEITEDNWIKLILNNQPFSKIEYAWMNDDGEEWMYNRGTFPSNLIDIPKEYYE